MTAAGLAIVATMWMALAGAPQATAGYEQIQQAFTMTSGTSTTSVTIPVTRSLLRDVVLVCPVLDSGDTATLALTVNCVTVTSGTLTYAPRGWSAFAIGATADGAALSANSSQLAVIVDGSCNFVMQAATNQAADRVFDVLLLLEN